MILSNKVAHGCSTQPGSSAKTEEIEPDEMCDGALRTTQPRPQPLAHLCRHRTTLPIRTREQRRRVSIVLEICDFLCFECNLSFHNIACDKKDHKWPPRRSLVIYFFVSSLGPNIDTRLTTSKSTVYRSSNFDRASVPARMRNAIGIGLRSQNLKISIRGHKATITADNECVWLVW